MKNFIPGLFHGQAAPLRRWLIVSGDHICVIKDSFLHESQALASIPSSDTCFELKVGQVELGGQLCDCYCYFVESAQDIVAASPEWQFYPLRSFLLRQSDVAFQLLGASVQLGHWLKDHRFCGRCAQLLVMRDDDRALYCEGCNHRYYPRLSPCVIMLITQGDRCLLAVHKRAQAPIYTALAGFVEAGETLEQAVAREALEEVGVKISRSDYVGSQPWPFPGQLMVGFIAQAAGDASQISLQDEEISDARWFKFDQLPELIPPAQTLSGQLIRHFVDSCKKA